MVPLPVQAAMVAALSDETHVHEQAARYVARRKVLVAALTAAGFTIDFSEAGLYIWCSRSESDWEMVAWFADRGILTTPGSFYGQAGKNCLRISLTATDKNINAAADRIRQG
jgi:aspartate/methionine/tyrosine aminotransferase